MMIFIDEDEEEEEEEKMVGMSLVGVKPSPLQPQQLPSLRGGVLRRIRCGIAEASGQPAPLGQKTRYNDGIFEKAFMSLFARKMEKYADPAGGGKGSAKKGWWDWGYDYESFVDVSRRVMQRRSRIQQQQVVREVLLSMLPPGAPAQVHPPLHFSFPNSICLFNSYAFSAFAYASALPVQEIISANKMGCRV